MSRFQLLMLIIYAMLQNDENFNENTRRAISHAYAVQWACWKNTWRKSWYEGKATKNAWENEDKYPEANIITIAGETFQVLEGKAKPYYRKNMKWSTEKDFERQTSKLKEWQKFVKWIKEQCWNDLQDFKPAPSTQRIYAWWCKIRDEWREVYEEKFESKQKEIKEDEAKQVNNLEEYQKWLQKVKKELKLVGH